MQLLPADSDGPVEKSTMVRHVARTVRNWWRDKSSARRWERAGCPVPPPPVAKRSILQGYLQTSGLRTFVETGTFHGDTLAYMRSYCDELHSIELSEHLHAAALERFRGDGRIRLWQGDSADVLPEVLKHLSRPALFWLDGHYSGDVTARGAADTPVRQELKALAGHHITEHTIVIDDARLFDGNNGYPTLEECLSLARALWPSHVQTVANDMIVLRPGYKPRTPA